MDENKYEDSDSDDDYKEVVVNSSDFRAEIYEFVDERDLSIVKCIGQIQSQYDYQLENEYKASGVGTGTVYKVANNVAFVLSCAHNIRHKIYECTKCNVYNKIKSCSKCEETLDSTHKKLLSPTYIEFKRRNIVENNFGHAQKIYTSEEIYVPAGYEQNTTLQRGFDFAILMFRDEDEYYSQHCCDITLDIGTNALKMYKRFCMFGYPGRDCENAKKNKLFGYAMKSDAKEKGFQLKECEQPKANFENPTKYALRQCQIDASAGQSGSVLFAVTSKTQTVFGVHVGGHKKKKGEVQDYSYNVATLLSEEYVKILDNATDLYAQNLENHKLRNKLSRQNALLQQGVDKTSNLYQETKKLNRQNELLQCGFDKISNLYQETKTKLNELQTKEKEQQDEMDKLKSQITQLQQASILSRVWSNTPTPKNERMASNYPGAIVNDNSQTAQTPQTVQSEKVSQKQDEQKVDFVYEGNIEPKGNQSAEKASLTKVMNGCIYSVKCLNDVSTPSNGYVSAINGGIYANCEQKESLFEFIECDKKKNKWYIKYKGQDKYQDYWLTYWSSSAYLYKSKKDRAVWQLQQENNQMNFKINCYYNNKYKGGLCKRGNAQRISVVLYESDIFALTPAFQSKFVYDQ